MNILYSVGCAHLNLAFLKRERKIEFVFLNGGNTKRKIRDYRLISSLVKVSKDPWKKEFKKLLIN